jgi:hypothetical protein
MLRSAGLIFASVLCAVNGHGMMLDPISRNAREGINTLGGSMWFSQGCSIGCSQCNDTGVPVGPGFPVDHKGTLPSPNIGSYLGDECPNDHSKSKNPTIVDPALTTMNFDSKVQPSLAFHPWRAPGSTPGLDPCGVAGGASTNMSMRAGGFGPETGYPQGFKGSKLPPIPKDQRKVWAAGETAEVSWVAVANHAGGYTYSLCPADQELTEDCFDKTPLQFVYNNSKLRYMFLKNNGTLSPNQTEVIIPANRVTEGVLPKGSMWSKNPIPAGSWVSKGWQGNQEPPQFEPPAGCDKHCWVRAAHFLRQFTLNKKDASYDNTTHVLHLLITHTFCAYLLLTRSVLIYFAGLPALQRRLHTPELRRLEPYSGQASELQQGKPRRPTQERRRVLPHYRLHGDHRRGPRPQSAARRLCGTVEVGHRAEPPDLERMWRHRHCLKAKS